MSQVTDLCRGDSDDNGECPNTTAVPSHSLSRKRPRDIEEISYNDPEKNATPDSEQVAIGLENDGDASSEEALPNQTGDWANKFKELCAYHQSKQHCNFRCQDPEYVELSRWVFSQRCEYRRMVGGKESILTPERVRALNGIGFVWNAPRPCWESQLIELADFRKNHGHCNVPYRCSENSKLARWVEMQRAQYRLHLKGEKSSMTLSRIQELKSVGLEWHGATWEDRLSELADYRKIHGHCDIPGKYSENTKLANWVQNQRQLYKLQQQGKTSSLTLSRIQALESLGFDWKPSIGGRGKERLNNTCWGDRLRELADYRKIHGHCNVPHRYSETRKLGTWVTYQRTQYKLQQAGKRSNMTLSRIKALDSLGFVWKPSFSRGKGISTKSSLDNDATRARDIAAEAPEHTQTAAPDVPSLPLFRKRPRDIEDLSYNDPATDSADFGIGLENDGDASSEEALPNQAGDWVSIPSLFFPGKRPRNKEEASANDAPPSNEIRNEMNGPGKKRTTTPGSGSGAEFVFDLELATGAEVASPHKKQRGVGRREPSRKNGVAGNCAQIRKRVHATTKDVDSEDAKELTDHREFHEGIAAAIAVSHPMKIDSEQTSRDDGSIKKRYQKVSPSKSPSNALGRQRETSMSAAAVAWRAPQFINLQDLIANNNRLGRKSRIIIDDSDDSSEEAHPIGREARTIIDDSDDYSEEEVPYQGGNGQRSLKKGV
jgi:hypothetical protein